jgi:hypothetical protein
MSNREILIKLAEGKKLRQNFWSPSEYIYMTEAGEVLEETDVSYCLDVDIDNDTWHEYAEPMQWEAEVLIGGVGPHPNGELYVAVPNRFAEKRVRIVVEEILR